MEELLKQILGELKDIKSSQVETSNRLTKIEDKLEAVYNQTAVLTEFRTETNKILDKMDDKIDNLQVDVNNLSVKTISNDNKIIEISRNIKKVK